ncbi:hypothetical protein OQA88_4289 [Cercophora sp. LCS_1]
MCDTQVDIASNRDSCLLCGEELALPALQEHLASHMEDIAIFVLPKIEENCDPEAANSSLQLAAGGSRGNNNNSSSDKVGSYDFSVDEDQLGHSDAISMLLTTQEGLTSTLALDGKPQPERSYTTLLEEDHEEGSRHVLESYLDFNPGISGDNLFRSSQLTSLPYYEDNKDSLLDLSDAYDLRSDATPAQLPDLSGKTLKELQRTLGNLLKRGRAKAACQMIASCSDSNPQLLNSYWLGDTPLLAAARHGYPEVVKLLLENGATIEFRDMDQELTALHWAARNGHYEVAKILVSYGADVTAMVTKHHGETPLSLAMGNGHSDIAALLVENGASAAPKTLSDSEDQRGLRPLEQAVADRDVDGVRDLVDKGEDVNFVNSWGETLLMIAAAITRPIIVDLLLELGADCEIRNRHGRTALWIAVKENNPRAVAALIGAGARVDVRDSANNALLPWMIQTGRTDCMSLLLNGGADIEIQDGKGMTALAWAAKNGYQGVSRELLRRGANPTTANSAGRTPADFAKERSEVLKVFTEFSASK